MAGGVRGTEIVLHSLRWHAGRDMSKTRGLRFSHVLIDRRLIHVHTIAFFKTKPINVCLYQTTYNQCRRLASTRADRFVKLLARRAYNMTGGEVSGKGSRSAESGRPISRRISTY